MKARENKAQNIHMQRQCVVICKRNSNGNVLRTLRSIWYKYRKDRENTLWIT